MTVGEAMSASSVGSSGQIPIDNVQFNPVISKTGVEILTSLNLIKDIRRLEKYQRDFFLKVRESLNHVQVLLDQQLTDMAWSDNLTDSEESLLKASATLLTSSPSQVAELHNFLLNDRDRLTSRFQEMSVKSSLSEFVVNSRALLDFNSAKMAAEAILKNEKPLMVRPDQSIPFDHTFFLANFCTASLASLMLATTMPKPVASFMTVPPPSNNYSSPQQRTNAPTGYESSKKLNGNIATNGTETQTPTTPNEHLRVTPKNGRPLPGVQYPAATNPQSPMSSNPVLPPQTGQAVIPNIYESPVPAANEAGNELANGMYGHTLVSAISQIARRDDNGRPKSSPTAHPSVQGGNVGGVATGGGKMQHDPWGPKVDEKPAPIASVPDARYGRVASGGGNRYGPSNTGSEIPHQNDNSSDELCSSTSEETGAEASVSGPTERDRSGKPLSFARITSLNLEKQAMVTSSQKQQNNQSATGLPSLQTAIDRALMALGPPTSLNDNVAPIISLPPSSNPRYFFDIVMDGKRLGRVVIEVDANMAPKMAQNFHSLVTGDKGYGYRGCQFFQVWKNESVICGDWEHNSGRGGRAALEDGSLFTPDETKLPCIRGAVGMRRMSKKHSTLNEVASQFRIILANMSNHFTGIFGHVVSNLEVIDRVANFGGDGGRPEKIATVANCGVYKH